MLIFHNNCTRNVCSSHKHQESNFIYLHSKNANSLFNWKQNRSRCVFHLLCGHQSTVELVSNICTLNWIRYSRCFYFILFDDDVLFVVWFTLKTGCQYVNKYKCVVFQIYVVCSCAMWKVWGEWSLRKTHLSMATAR